MTSNDGIPVTTEGLASEEAYNQQNAADIFRAWHVYADNFELLQELYCYWKDKNATALFVESPSVHADVELIEGRRSIHLSVVSGSWEFDFSLNKPRPGGQFARGTHNYVWVIHDNHVFADLKNVNKSQLWDIVKGIYALIQGEDQ